MTKNRNETNLIGRTKKESGANFVRHRNIFMSEIGQESYLTWFESSYFIEDPYFCIIGLRGAEDLELNLVFVR